MVESYSGRACGYVQLGYSVQIRVVQDLALDGVSPPNGLRHLGKERLAAARPGRQMGSCPMSALTQKDFGCNRLRDEENN